MILRAAFILSAIVGGQLLVACGSEPDVNALTDSASGEVVVYDGKTYPLTSENYRRWLVAQAALDSLEEPEDPPLIDVDNPTDDQIETVIESLEDDEASRRAIERSGLSVQDFVLTSLVLGRSLASSTAGAPDETDAFLSAHRAQIAQRRAAQRYHIIREPEWDDDEDDDDDDGDDRGRGKGKKKGHRHKHH